MWLLLCTARGEGEKRWHTVSHPYFYTYVCEYRKCVFNRITLDLETIIVHSAITIFSQLNMESTVEDSNEKHLEPWSKACDRDGITSTPLSPYLDPVCCVLCFT